MKKPVQEKNVKVEKRVKKESNIEEEVNVEEKIKAFVEDHPEELAELSRRGIEINQVNNELRDYIRNLEESNKGYIERLKQRIDRDVFVENNG